jgi:hypothetical protein
VALSSLLILLSVGSVFGFWKSFTGREELFALYPRLRPLWFPYLCIAPVNILSAVALWRWRRWGLWLACVLAAVAMAIELHAMGPAPHVFRVPVALVLLVWLARREWTRFL